MLTTLPRLKNTKGITADILPRLASDRRKKIPQVGKVFPKTFVKEEVDEKLDFHCIGLDKDKNVSFPTVEAECSPSSHGTEVRPQSPPLETGDGTEVTLPELPGILGSRRNCTTQSPDVSEPLDLLIKGEAQKKSQTQIFLDVIEERPLIAPEEVMRTKLEPIIDSLFEEDELFTQDFEQDGLNRVLFIRKMGIYVEIKTKDYIPGIVCTPLFHCNRCKDNWIEFGTVPENCQFARQPTRGPPIHLASNRKPRFDARKRKIKRRLGDIKEGFIVSGSGTVLSQIDENNAEDTLQNITSPQSYSDADKAHITLTDVSSRDSLAFDEAKLENMKLTEIDSATIIEAFKEVADAQTLDKETYVKTVAEALGFNEDQYSKFARVNINKTLDKSGESCGDLKTSSSRKTGIGKGKTVTSINDKSSVRVNINKTLDKSGERCGDLQTSTSSKTEIGKGKTVTSFNSKSSVGININNTLDKSGESCGDLKKPTSSETGIGEGNTVTSFNGKSSVRVNIDNTLDKSGESCGDFKTPTSSKTEIGEEKTVTSINGKSSVIANINNTLDKSGESCGDLKTPTSSKTGIGEGNTVTSFNGKSSVRVNIDNTLDKSGESCGDLKTPTSSKTGIGEGNTVTSFSGNKSSVHVRVNIDNTLDKSDESCGNFKRPTSSKTEIGEEKTVTSINNKSSVAVNINNTLDKSDESCGDLKTPSKTEIRNGNTVTKINGESSVRVNINKTLDKSDESCGDLKTPTSSNTEIGEGNTVANINDKSSMRVNINNILDKSGEICGDFKTPTSSKTETGGGNTVTSYNGKLSLRSILNLWMLDSMTVKDLPERMREKLLSLLRLKRKRRQEQAASNTKKTPHTVDSSNEISESYDNLVDKAMYSEDTANDRRDSTVNNNRKRRDSWVKQRGVRGQSIGDINNPDDIPGGMSFASGQRHSLMSSADLDEEDFSTSRSPGDVLAYEELQSQRRSRKTNPSANNRTGQPDTPFQRLGQNSFSVPNNSSSFYSYDDGDSDEETWGRVRAPRVGSSRAHMSDSRTSYMSDIARGPHVSDSRTSMLRKYSRAMGSARSRKDVSFSNFDDRIYDDYDDDGTGTKSNRERRRKSVLSDLDDKISHGSLGNDDSIYDDYDDDGTSTTSNRTRRQIRKKEKGESVKRPMNYHSKVITLSQGRPSLSHVTATFGDANTMYDSHARLSQARISLTEASSALLCDSTVRSKLLVRPVSSIAFKEPSQKRKETAESECDESRAVDNRSESVDELPPLEAAVPEGSITTPLAQAQKKQSAPGKNTKRLFKRVEKTKPLISLAELNYIHRLPVSSAFTYSFYELPSQHRQHNATIKKAAGRIGRRKTSQDSGHFRSRSAP